MNQNKTMKRIRLMLLVLLLLSQWAWGSLKSNNLLNFCSEYFGGSTNVEAIMQSGTCVGYVMGIIELHTSLKTQGHIAENLWCIPTAADNDQLIGTVFEYLETHPEQLHFSASTLVGTALVEAFPCNINDSLSE
jgi:hypothetical protein